MTAKHEPKKVLGPGADPQPAKEAKHDVVEPAEPIEQETLK